MPCPALPDVDATDPVELLDGDETQAIEPLPGWDGDAHADEYADDPAVQVTDGEAE